jgi:hypothetical protein
VTDGSRWNERALEAKDAGRSDEELMILLDAVAHEVDTPYTYDRAALLLDKAGRTQEALDVCRRALSGVLAAQASAPRVEAIRKRQTRLEKKIQLD